MSRPIAGRVKALEKRTGTVLRTDPPPLYYCIKLDLILGDNLGQP